MYKTVRELVEDLFNKKQTQLLFFEAAINNELRGENTVWKSPDFIRTFHNTLDKFAFFADRDLYVTKTTAALFFEMFFTRVLDLYANAMELGIYRYEYEANLSSTFFSLMASCGNISCDLFDLEMRFARNILSQDYNRHGLRTPYVAQTADKDYRVCMIIQPKTANEFNQMVVEHLREEKG